MKKTVREQRELIEVKGRASIEGQDTENSQIFVVLNSNSANYIFNTLIRQQPHVTAAFIETGLDYDSSGFVARIPVQSIENGLYEIGIYIQKDDIVILQYGFTHDSNRNPQVTVMDGVWEYQ